MPMRVNAHVFVPVCACICMRDWLSGCMCKCTCNCVHMCTCMRACVCAYEDWRASVCVGVGVCALLCECGCV